MTTQNIKPDTAWGELSGLGQAEREDKMRARYQELAKLSESERVDRLFAMAQAEYSLNDERLRPFTTSRMRVWIGMDLETAKTVVASYDKAMEVMPGVAAMRRVTLVQNLAMTFSLEEQSKLRVLVPKIFAGRGDIAQLVKETAATKQAPAEKKKSGWGPFKK